MRALLIVGLATAAPAVAAPANTAEAPLICEWSAALPPGAALWTDLVRAHVEVKRSAGRRVRIRVTADPLAGAPPRIEALSDGAGYRIRDV